MPFRCCCPVWESCSERVNVASAACAICKRPQSRRGREKCICSSLRKDAKYAEGSHYLPVISRTLLVDFFPSLTPLGKLLKLLTYYIPVRSWKSARRGRKRLWRVLKFSNKVAYVQICQKRRRIGCMIPHCKLQRGFTQPILRHF